MAGAPSMPVHGSALKRDSTVALSAVEVMTSAKSWATVPLSRSRWSSAPGKSSPIGANSSMRTPTTSRMDPGYPPSQMWSRSSEMPV